MSTDVNEVFMRYAVVSYQAESVRLRYRWAEYGRVTGSGLTVTIILGFMLGWFSVEI